MNSRISRSFWGFVLFALSIVIGLLVVEGACRLYINIVLADVPLTRWEFREKRPPPYQDADYFSADFLFESQNSFRPYWVPGKDYAQLEDSSGKFFNVVNGLRATTDSPPSPSGRILLFGGSTMFSAEVPDWATIPSYLQRLINSTCEARIIVLNYGVPSMNTRQQTSRLADTALSTGDIVVFFDGINDIYYSVFFGTEGYMGTSAGFRPIQAIPAWRRKLYDIFHPWKDKSAIAWMLSNVYDLGVPRTITDESILAGSLQTSSANFQAAISDANRLVATKDGMFFNFLQPHLFAAPLSTPYRRALASNYLQTPPGLETAFRIGYPRLRAATREARAAGIAAFDLSEALAPVPDEVFLDFGHMNHRGNEVVAQAIFSNIRSRIRGCGN